MVELRVDGMSVRVEPGTTLLEAAARVGVRIPSLCGGVGRTSCMVCTVRDLARNRLLPACAAPAEDGMDIDCSSPNVVLARRRVLELLLSRHLGDCRAPCTRFCPAGLDIPRMVRTILVDGAEGAASVLRERVPFVASLGYICPAPCERACRRGAEDRGVAIRELHRACGEMGLEDEAVEGVPATGHRAAVIGAGPAGLTAAWRLARAGWGVAVFEESPDAGGGLREAPELPAHVLAAEIELIRRAGVLLHPGRIVDPEGFTRLRSEWEAVIVATGSNRSPHPDLPVDGAGRLVREEDGRVRGQAGVYCVGSAARPSTMAVRGMADGARVAEALMAAAGCDTGADEVFESKTRPSKTASPAEQRVRLEGPEGVRNEAERCLQCDCAAAADCDLRSVATECLARQPRGLVMDRPDRMVGRSIVFEPGKCILCGRCVEISRECGHGMVYLGRGVDLRVGPALGVDIDTAVGATAAACVSACPTGALVAPGDQPGRYG